jgi:thymidylate kinase
MAESGRCVVIDATEPKQAVADRVWKTVNERLDPATAPMHSAGVGS